METKTNRKAVLDALLGLLDFHTRLFHNVLDGVSDTDAANRLGTPANHMAWIAGSLLQERFVMARLLGAARESAATDELFHDHQGIREDSVYPSLDAYRREWDMISPVLHDTLAGLSEEQLGGPDPYKMPGGNYTLMDAVGFCTDRESYCIGQLGLWRRLLGYKPMSYT